MIVNLLDRMKLPFRKNKEFLSALYDILGFYPHNIEIYRIAFSHKSLGFRRDEKTSTKDRKGFPKDKRERRVHSENTSKPLNNERLEYLGDAVLETVVSDILFRHFSNKREGFLTSTRSKIVQREALNRLATQMGLESLIVAAQGTRMSHTNIGGNAFEALMGAIYLDRGYKFCHWFISNRIVGRYVDLDNVAQKEVNFKSKLLEWSQKNRINTNFKDSVSDNGEKGFSTVITIEGIIMGRGNGRSKKESQQEASKEALTRMRKNAQTYDNIFRAKEKRTAMEAEESFALPKIDEIEESLNKGGKGKKNISNEDAPVLEGKKKNKTASISDKAYDTAYDTTAHYEVIDTPPAEEDADLSFLEEKGIPAPPAEDELRAADEKLRKKRARNRGAKTVGDAVKGISKGTSTAEEKAEKREAERIAEVERQRAKAERKRAENEKKKQVAETKVKAKKAEPISTTEATTKDVQPKIAEEKISFTSAIETTLVETETTKTALQPLTEAHSNASEEIIQEETITAPQASESTSTNVDPIATKGKDKEEDASTSEVFTAPSVTAHEEQSEASTLIIKQDIHVEAEPTEKEVEVEEKADEYSPVATEATINKDTEEELVAASSSSEEEVNTTFKEAQETTSETPAISSIPTLTFDDIIFGTNHEHLANIGSEEITDEEQTEVTEIKKPSKASQNRRKRRSSAPKGEKPSSANKPEKKATTTENRKVNASASETTDKVKKVEEYVASQTGEEGNDNIPKRNNKRRHPYKGKRNNNAKPEQA